MNLSRTKGGKVVHRRDCRYANGPTSSGKPWLWADDKTTEQVLTVIITFGYRMCLHCNPLDGDRRHG